MAFSPPPANRDLSHDAADDAPPFVGPDGLAPVAQVNRWAIPTTLYVWLVLLVVSFAAPRFLPKAGGEAKAGRKAGLTAPDFQKYVAAETGAKAAFGLRNLPTIGGDRSAKMLAQAVGDYRALLATEPSPNIARRILILEHSLHKPLDEKLLTGSLKDALSRAKTPPSEQSNELSLWRGIYGDGGQSGDFARNGAAQIKAMKLRFWQPRALADLYQAAGQKTQAERAEDVFRQGATRFTVKQSVLGLSIAGVFLAGLVFLVLFIVAAAAKNWPLVRRVATENQPLAWGDLLDVWVFYLMCIFIARPLVALLAPQFFPKPTLQIALFLSAVVYVSTALFATAYLAGILKKRNASWSAVYFRAPHGLAANIAYGLAGYAATLPISLALGSLSRLIFQNNANTTPNPVLPLIAGEQDPLGRIVIYLLAAVAAPLFEELFFRGVLFSGLRTRFGWVVSGLISGACFALVHPMQDWLPIFGLGFALATMREMRQSLVPGMVAHFCQNSMAFVSLSVIFSE